MKLQIRESEWFYDDAGYYSYVMLNTSKDIFNQVKEILIEHGLSVSVAGQSCCPATNGIQYQWYIRIADEQWQKPSREMIEEIFAPYDIETLLTDRENLQLRVESLEAQIYSLRQHNEELRGSYTLNQKELYEYREKAYELEANLLNLQSKGVASEEMESIREHYEQQVINIQTKLAAKEEELMSWVETFEPELSRRERTIQELKNQITMLNERLQTIAAQQYAAKIAKTEQTVKTHGERLFGMTIELLLPTRKFLGGSFETLWREMPEPASQQTLTDISMLENLKAKRIRGMQGSGWLERHIKDEWRLYYRKNKDSLEYEILISHKDLQDRDFLWLKQQ